PGGTIGAAMPVQIAPGSQEAQPVGEKYVSYFREEMRSTAEVRGRNGDIAAKMVDADRDLPGISPKGKLLTLTSEGALQHKIADVEADSLQGALEKLKIEGEVRSISPTWSEALVGFLTSQAVSGLLFMLMVVLAYLEYQTPGFGFFGYGAFACFAVLFFSHYLVNLAGWEEMILFALGIILILTELFVTPGFGIAGIIGLLCLFLSGVLLFLAGDPWNLDFKNPFVPEAIFRVLLSGALSIVAVLLLIRYLPKEGKRTGKIVLGGVLAAEEGYVSHETLPDAGVLIGQEGDALTVLRPSGRARIAGERWEVESEGEFIDAGARVRVVRVDGGKVVVRKV
ncbi:MAG: NfeD family protein, partial [Bdellovibrionota bacterium]